MVPTRASRTHGRYPAASVDFEFIHEIPAPPDAVCDALLDEDYQRSLADLGSLADRELLKQKKLSSGHVRREVRCVLDIELNSTVKKFVGDGDPAWVEESEWDPDKRTWTWNVEPEVGGGLLEASGVMVIEPDGDDTRRKVTGTVKVHVPLYGGKVEGIIVGGLERAYEEEAQRLKEWVERG